MKFLKRGLLFLLAILTIFVAILLYNTFGFESRQLSAKPAPSISLDPSAVSHFSQALQFKTVSTDDPADLDSTQFRGFAQFLVETYPLSDSLLNKKTFNDFSFLYHWPGTASELKPIVLIAHLDVVPVIERNLPDWREDPFGGRIVRDTVWGRGAIDDKNVVISLLESVELLLKQGYQPRRGIYLAIVHDEEIGGIMGAKPIADYLKSQKVEVEYVLDEGGYITQGIIPGIEPDLALIGIAEKGFLSLEMKVKIQGGHSSIPNDETAIDVLAKAVSTLKEHPFPARITPPIEGFIQYVGPELPFIKKVVFANSFMLKSLIISAYEKKTSGNALVRTTTAPTLFHSGVKDNVVPQLATATVNFRILPGETIESVIDYVKTTINDKRISLVPGAFRSEPSEVSSIESWSFQTLHRTIAETYPKVLLSPYLMVGATDSRHFSDLAKDIYRFTPIRINSKNIKSFHGLNECLPVRELENSIRFYVQLIKNSDQEAP